MARKTKGAERGVRLRRIALRLQRRVGGLSPDYGNISRYIRRALAQTHTSFDDLLKYFREHKQEFRDTILVLSAMSDKAWREPRFSDPVWCPACRTLLSRGDYLSEAERDRGIVTRCRECGAEAQVNPDAVTMLAALEETDESQQG